MSWNKLSRDERTFGPGLGGEMHSRGTQIWIEIVISGSRRDWIVIGGHRAQLRVWLRLAGAGVLITSTDEMLRNELQWLTVRSSLTLSLRLA